MFGANSAKGSDAEKEASRPRNVRLRLSNENAGFSVAGLGEGISGGGDDNGDQVPRTCDATESEKRK